MPAPSINDKTADPSYKEWFKFRLDIKDREGNGLYNIDTFQDLDYNEGLNLYRLSCSTGSLQSGFFDLSFFDNERIIDTTKVGLGNIVTIEGSKRSDTFRNIFYGFCRELEPTRPGGGGLRWRMSGFGSGIVAREILLNIERKARLFDIGDPTRIPDDPATQANNLIQDILENPEFVVYGDDPLHVIIGCTMNGIDVRAHDTVPFLSAVNGDADTIIRQIADTVGLVYGWDADNDFYLRYPSSVHSGVNIKVLQLGQAYNNTDFALNTAYVMGPYAAPISINKEDGFGNVCRSSALTNRDFLGGSVGREGFKSIAFQGLAQRFVPGSLGFAGLAFLLSKVGTVTSPKNRLNGAILKDSGDPNDVKPTNIKIATFHISLDDIPADNPEPVEEIDMNIINENFDPQAPHWVALYINNGILWDEENCPRWHHNNDFVTPGQYSAVAVGATRETTDPPWQIFPSGPTFAYAAFQTLRHEVLASDPFSVDRYGPIMLDVPNDFIDDTFTMNKYINTQLAVSSVPQIRYSPLQVRIPNDMVFKHDTQVTFIDEKIGATNFVNRQAGIQQVRYDWDAFASPQGIKTCELTILGYYDWYVESEPLTICQNI